MKRRPFHFSLIGAVILLSAGLFWVSAQQSRSLLVIEGATLIDGTGRKPIPNAVVVIENDRIQAVFRHGEQVYPRGARVIQDLGTQSSILCLILIPTSLRRDWKLRPMP